MRLSPHFTLKEMTSTSVRMVDNTPNVDEVKNLTFLATKVLETVRARFGPLHTNSAYRSPMVNRIIGGSPTSMHMRGCAWDGVPIEDVPLSEIVGFLDGRQDLPVDQVIYEFGKWVHIGTRPEGKGCRHQVLMIFQPGKYELWNPKDPRVVL